MENVDDILFKKYSNGKNFNSFIDEFDRATIEENKGKVAKELKIVLLSIMLKWSIIIMNTNINYLILLMVLIIF